LFFEEGMVMNRVKFLCALCLVLVALALWSSSGADASGTTLFNPAENDARTEDIRIRTDLVTLTVSVLDRKGQPVSGLGREHFEIYEDKVKQQIEFFSEREAPASIGIVFDVSGSMQSKLEQSQEAVKLFVEASHPEDEFFLMTFNEKIYRMTDFIRAEALLSHLSSVSAAGDTALYDALYAGVEKLKEGRHKKHVLLVLSDGADNQSRYNFREVRQFIKESDALIYAISTGRASSGCARLCHQQAQMLLEELVNPTGGKTYFPLNREDLEDAANEIAVTIRRQYSLGYVPGNPVLDGKWRNINARLSHATQPSKVTVRTRAGYYASR
jgi:Ca-activated chloride channel family protein